MRILAATDFSVRSIRALRQAGLVAQAEGAELHVLHVIDDDLPSDLIRLETREAERIIAEQIASMPELQGVRSSPLVIAGDPFDGILRAADDLQPDLIVLGAHRKQLLLDIFSGTTIERVIRRGRYPVLMVNHEAQRKYERVVAPVDMSDASANALRVARATGLIADDNATLLHAFEPLWKGERTLADADNAAIKAHAVDERQRAVDGLAAFLVNHDLGSGRWSIRIEEGEPMDVISRTVEETRPDLLVMGTRSRPALLKALIGSVTEEALRSLNVDILAVPLERQS